MPAMHGSTRTRASIAPDGHFSFRLTGLCGLSLLATIACSTNEGANNKGAGSTAAGGGSGGMSSAASSASGGSGGSGSASKVGGSSGGAGGKSTASANGGSSNGGSSSGTATGGTTGSATSGGATSVGGTGGKSTVATGGGAGTATGGTSSTGGAGGKSTGTAAGGMAGGTGGAAVTDTVTRSTSTFTFQHFPLDTNSSGVWKGSKTASKPATSTKFDTVVLESGILKVTLLPSYGGRILSIIHKPTNRELLYQNPLGTPYLMLEGIFYYDYLVVLGGIFPTFPEPEHGKYWNQPFEFKVVSESKDAITVRLSRKDDLDLATGVPAKYDVGRTDVLVEMDVTLRAGRSSLDVETKLTNTRDKPVAKFEFWLNTTLAPGSTPGKSAIPLNTRIWAVMDKAHLMEKDWSWFAKAEERISGEIFKWNNLSYFKNWQDQGIAYASPNYSANWSGLANYDNDMGIVRVADNAKSPGLKLWTFGKTSVDIDMNDPAQWFRPTIEMWHGITPEFWSRGTLAANEVRQCAQSFFLTMGMKEITTANEFGAVYLSSSKSGTDTVLSATATLTIPNQTVKAILRLDNNVVSEQDIVVDPTKANAITATVAGSKAPAGSVFAVEILQGDKSLLTAQKPLP
jgi:hypothetical protein